MGITEIKIYNYKNYSLVDLPGEIWKPINGYDNVYEVSNKGRIKSLARVLYRKTDGIRKTMKDAILKSALNSDGYVTVVLKKDYAPKTYSVHVLVGKHFLENPFNLPEINHKDGDKCNCDADNLEYSTRKSNMKHAVENGLRIYKKGINTGKHKLQKDHIVIIYKSSLPSAVLANKFNVTRSTIQRIRNGRNYKLITSAWN